MPSVVDGDGSKIRLYIGSVGLYAMLVMSLADRVCLWNKSGGRSASAHTPSAGLARRARRRHVFWIVSRRLR